MLKNITMVLIFIFSSSVLAEESKICGAIEADKEYQELREQFPRSDTDYSPKNGVEALKRMEKYLNGEKVEYFIPENTLSIIKGAYLLKLMNNNYLKVVEMEKTISRDKWGNEQYEIYFKYLKAKKEYCTHQRNELHIDW